MCLLLEPEGVLAEHGGRHAEVAAEAEAEVVVAGEAAVAGYLHDAQLGLLDEQHGGMLQALLLDVVRDAVMPAM